MVELEQAASTEEDDDVDGGGRHLHRDREHFAAALCSKEGECVGPKLLQCLAL